MLAAIGLKRGFISFGGPAGRFRCCLRNEKRRWISERRFTAAVVGVIVNLAVFFAWHVLWPQHGVREPFAGPFEWFSALLALGAAVALFRFKVGIIPVIAACAGIGGTYHILAA